MTDLNEESGDRMLHINKPKKSCKHPYLANGKCIKCNYPEINEEEIDKNGN